MKQGLIKERHFVGLIAAACTGLLILWPLIGFLLKIFTKPWDAWLIEEAIGSIPFFLAPLLFFFMTQVFWKKFVKQQAPDTRSLIAVAVSTIIVTVIIYVILQIIADYLGNLCCSNHRMSGAEGGGGEQTGAFGITAAAALCFFGMPNAALIAALYGWFWRDKLIKRKIIYTTQPSDPS